MCVRTVLLSLCIDDILTIIIDIWISYGALEWCVLRTGDIIGFVFTTYGALFVIISTVK
jgi:hypothetical protein